MSLVEYIRKRWDALSLTAQKTVTSQQEYKLYTLMTWERDYYKGEMERLERLVAHCTHGTPMDKHCEECARNGRYTNAGWPE